MNATVSRTAALAALGTLLEYPNEIFSLRCGKAPVAAFTAEISVLSTEQVQELYTRSFDLSPVCVPYLSVHLFGAESFKRGELMTGLKAAYERTGFACGTELPDHIAVVLQSAPYLDAEEWADLERFVIAPATEKMLAELEKAGSPWRHVVAAVRALLPLGDESDA